MTNRSEALTVEDIAPELDDTPQSSKFYRIIIRNAQGQIIDTPLASPDRRGILIHAKRDRPLGRLAEGADIDEVREL